MPQDLPPLDPESLPQWSDIGQYLHDARENLNGPIPLFTHTADKAIGTLVKHPSGPGTLRQVGLINYAYSNWRSAVLLGQTGNSHQVPVVLRPAVEALGYAHLFLKEHTWQKCWESRHKSKSAEQKFRRHAPKAARDCLKSASPDLASRVEELTQEFVDFGGHPNVSAVEASTSYFQNSEDKDIGFVVFSQLAGVEERYFAQLSIIRTADIFLDTFKIMRPNIYHLFNTDSLRENLHRQIKIYREQNR